MAKRLRETPLQARHGHCADVLMTDFGVPKDMRERICEEIDKIYVQVSMVHCMIIWSVRGFQPNAVTHSLEQILSAHATHEQRNTKNNPGPQSGDL